MEKRYKYVTQKQTVGDLNVGKTLKYRQKQRVGRVYLENNLRRQRKEGNLRQYALLETMDYCIFSSLFPFGHKTERYNNYSNYIRDGASSQ